VTSNNELIFYGYEVQRQSNLTVEAKVSEHEKSHALLGMVKKPKNRNASARILCI
jgi:hypothetical protein